MAASFEFRSILAETIFTRRVDMALPAYIRAMHPKSEIRPELASVERILKTGWVGQLKIHGHRAQVHIPADPEQDIIIYNRQGKQHKLLPSSKIKKELLRVFKPEKNWNVLDAEWLKGEEKLFVFDFLKKDGVVLRTLTYPERWALLPRAFLSPHVSVLPLIRDLAACQKVLQGKADHVEGLVFKSSTSTGFSDTSIVRCRKRK